jgi:hypothetical protein
MAGLAPQRSLSHAEFPAWIASHGCKMQLSHRHASQLRQLVTMQQVHERAQIGLDIFTDRSRHRRPESYRIIPLVLPVTFSINALVPIATVRRKKIGSQQRFTACANTWRLCSEVPAAYALLRFCIVRDRTCLLACKHKTGIISSLRTMEISRVRRRSSTWQR